jgi:hypothetical protein
MPSNEFIQPIDSEPSLGLMVGIVRAELLHHRQQIKAFEKIGCGL